MAFLGTTSKYVREQSFKATFKTTQQSHLLSKLKENEYIQYISSLKCVTYM